MSIETTELLAELDRKIERMKGDAGWDTLRGTLERCRDVIGPVAPTHRHKKRGSEYVLIGIGRMQSENWHAPVPLTRLGLTEKVDMREVAVYRSVDDGSLWVRPREEFEDGRFETLAKELPQ